MKISSSGLNEDEIIHTNGMAISRAPMISTMWRGISVHLKGLRSVGTSFSWAVASTALTERSLAIVILCNAPISSGPSAAAQ